MQNMQRKMQNDQTIQILLPFCVLHCLFCILHFLMGG